MCFVVDDQTAAAVQRAYQEGGPASAAAVLRAAFAGLSEVTAATAAAAIAGWQLDPTPGPNRAPAGRRRRRPAP